MSDQINSASKPNENEGIDPQILSIRLSQESECWEDMTEKVIAYLESERENKLNRKADGVKEKERLLEKALEENKDKPAKLQRKKTGRDIPDAEDKSKNEKKKDKKQSLFGFSQSDLNDYLRDITKKMQ